MARFAFVFPGQGAQYVGMGKELAQNFVSARQVFEQADDIVGYQLSTLCFEGPDNKLNTTQYAQPGLLVTSLAALEVLKLHNIEANIYAGLSLGEYTALVASGALSLEEALPLVQERAKLMQNAVPAEKAAMAAVLGLADKQVEDVCSKVEGIVDVANYNCPGQIVISGEKDAVGSACDLLQEAGARTKLLAVSVPSHSRLMYEAAMKFKTHLDKIIFKKADPGVVSNVNVQENDARDFADILVKQLYSPVRWEQSVRYMMEKVDYFIEVGPGSVLSGLIKRIDRKRILGQVEDLKSLEKVLKEVESLDR